MANTAQFRELAVNDQPVRTGSNGMIRPSGRAPTIHIYSPYRIDELEAHQDGAPGKATAEGLNQD